MKKMKKEKDQGVCRRDRHQVSSSAPSDHPAAYLGSFAQMKMENNLSCPIKNLKREKIQLPETLNQKEDDISDRESLRERERLQGSLSSAREKRRRVKEREADVAEKQTLVSLFR